MDRNRFRNGNLEGPLVIIAASESTLLLVRQEEANDPMADCQMFELDQEPPLFEEIKPLGVWLKFMYGMDVINPVPFTEQEKALRLEAYRAAQRAREAASGN